MSIVVLFALRKALDSARKDAGVTEKWFNLGFYFKFERRFGREINNFPFILGAPSTPDVIFLNSGNSVESYTLHWSIKTCNGDGDILCQEYTCSAICRRFLWFVAFYWDWVSLFSQFFTLVFIILLKKQPSLSIRIIIDRSGSTVTLGFRWILKIILSNSLQVVI